MNSPQVSTSLQWGDPGVLTRRQITTQPASPPAVVSVPQTGSVENVEIPLAPRASKPTRASKTSPVQEECLSGHISRASAEQEKQKQPADGVSTNHTCGLAETGKNYYQLLETMFYQYYMYKLNLLSVEPYYAFK